MKADLHFDGVTRPLSLLDMVVLQYTTTPTLPTAEELVALAESNPSLRAQVHALAADPDDASLCCAKKICAVLSVKAAAIDALEETR